MEPDPRQRAERYQAEGRDADALAVWSHAIEQAPGTPGPLTGKANLLLDLGRVDEAEWAFHAALRLAPGHGPALYGQASIAHFRGETVDTGWLERVLDRTQVADDRFHLHFALGRAYLEADAPDAAFRHFTAGNALRRSTYVYDVADDERLLLAIAAAFPAELLARAPDEGDPDDTPIFIVGMPRSGTSLLEQQLAAHPAIHGAGELLTLRDIVLHDLTPHGMFPEVAAILTAAQRRMLGRRYLDLTRALAPDARRIIDKLPLNFYFCGLIRMMLPNARILHIRRDPLDTCLSCYTTLFRQPVRYAHDLGELGRFHRAYRQLMEHWRQVLPADQFIEVEYSALVAEPEAETRRLLAACGLAWDEACRQPHLAGRPTRTASRLQVLQPVHGRSIGRAQRYYEYLVPLVSTLGLNVLGSGLLG